MAKTKGIPAEQAVIFWDTNSQAHEEGFDRRVTELVIVSLEEHRRDKTRYKHLSKSWGAVVNDWMNGDVFDTPMGLFLRLATVNGFVNEDTKLDVLEQFEKIEGQGWATELRRILGVDTENESDQ